VTVNAARTPVEVLAPVLDLEDHINVSKDVFRREWADFDTFPKVGVKR